LRNRVQVRIPYDLTQRIRQTLNDPWLHHEPVVFALASSSQTTQCALIHVNRLVNAPASAFIPSLGHGAKWSAQWNIELMNLCAESSLGLVIFHRHEGTHVALSNDDRQSAAQLLPYFQTFVPNRYHGSVVIGDHSAAGLVWRPGSKRPIEDVEVRLMGSHIETLANNSYEREEWEKFERIPLAENQINREIMRKAVVAVVGLSGGGSQIVTQLASWGVGRIIGIDPQKYDFENRLTTDCPWFIDLILGSRKTSVAKRQCFLVNRECRFQPIAAEIPSPAAVRALQEADIIVGSVNNLQARADLLEIAGRYGIPYVDIGFKVALGKMLDVAELSSLPGNAFTIVPGDFCLWCTGFLTKSKLENEAGGGDRSYLTLKSNTAQKSQRAYVSSFNGLLAGHAATEVLQLLLGWRCNSRGSRYYVYDGVTGEMQLWIGQRNDKCNHCINVVNAGEPIWN
jgi:hypothetical protein